MNRNPKGPRKCSCAANVMTLAFNSTPAWVVVVLCSLMLACAIGMSRQPLPEVSSTSRITVSSGQTLWSIARTHPVAGLDTPQTVEVIRRLNNLNDSSIAPGDVLYVPAHTPSSSDLAMR